MKLFLVTGASGHLGSTIVEQLLVEKQKIRVLLMPHDPFSFSWGDQVEVVYGSVVDKQSLLPFFENKDEQELIVIHCAGIVSIASKYSQKLYDVNVTGTKNIVELCEETPVQQLIYVSSVHAIPENKHKEVMKEVDYFDPKLVIGAYAKTKAEATQAVLEAAKRGLNACVVHPSGIVGPNDRGSGHMTQLLMDFFKGKLVAAVNGGYDFVDVRDVSNGIIRCSEKGKKGECYILANRYFQVKEILEILHTITDKKRVTLILPRWLVKLTAPLAEAYYKLVKRTPLFTAYSLYTLISNSRFSHEKATKELDYHTRPMEETLKDSIEWLKKSKRI